MLALPDAGLASFDVLGKLRSALVDIIDSVAPSGSSPLVRREARDIPIIVWWGTPSLSTWIFRFRRGGRPGAPLDVSNHTNRDHRMVT
jgi:hypothetical protein